MNSMNLSKVGISLTVTALALFGGLAISVSCSDSGSGGSGGNGTGGSGAGGDNGGSGGSGGGSCAQPGDDAVNFCDGKAQGVLAGYAYIALGAADAATAPVCAEDPNDLTVTRLITAPPAGSCDAAGKTCPTTGHTVWNATDKLCITGSIPKVVGGDYKGNWGLQIGVNTKDPPATDSTGTLGKTYTHMTFTTTGTVEPTNTAIRAVIHLVDMACDADPYCATMSASGKAMTLTSFNTECWGPTTAAKTLTAADIPNIDKIGIQISSDTTNNYTVTDFCLTGIQFDSN
jgi:hypothetical protein